MRKIKTVFVSVRITEKQRESLKIKAVRNNTNIQTVLYKCIQTYLLAK